MSPDFCQVWNLEIAEQIYHRYRAIFTILDVQKVTRAWVKDVLEGTRLSESSPQAWKDWVFGGVARPLKASRTLEHRSREEQLPASKHEKQMLERIRDYFKDSPHDFEVFAAELLKMAAKNITGIEVTKPSRDGRRDAIGEYRLGLGKDRIFLDFAVEAKCYGENNSVGVRETSRLISRLRHRQFGLFVTTSYVADQAYQEIREDKHPIIVISGGDITNILIEKGINTIESLERFLQTVFPPKKEAQV